MPTLSRLRLLLPLWSLWRLVLAGCLCVAIPLQGYAAASKALCPHHAAKTAPAAHAHAQVHAHAHVSDPSAHSHSAHPTSTDCSQCGDCCPGLAPMPGQAWSTEPHPLAQAAPTVARAPAPTFLTSGPERPPRRGT